MGYKMLCDSTWKDIIFLSNHSEFFFWWQIILFLWFLFFLNPHLHQWPKAVFLSFGLFCNHESVSSVSVPSLGGDGRLAASGPVFSSWLVSGPQYPWNLRGLLDEEEEVPAQRLAQGEHRLNSIWIFLLCLHWFSVLFSNVCSTCRFVSLTW